MLYSGKITERTFSFYTNRDGTSSQFDIGTPYTSHMKGNSLSRVMYIPVDGDEYFWAGWNQGISFGPTPNTTNSFAYEDQEGWRNKDTIWSHATYSIFDSSFPYIAISPLHFDAFLAQLFNHTLQDAYSVDIDDGLIIEEGGILMTRCTYDFPTIHFMFEQVWI